MKHVHLIGIGGTGLSAIALLLKEQGYTVTGSDRTLSPLAQQLMDHGVTVFTGHDGQNVQHADIVVRSSAVPDDNPEVIAAIEAGIPVMKRSEFLGGLLEGKNTIAVAGTHGKTTTTAMIAWCLSKMGKDPSYIIGGVAKNLGTNAHAGSGNDFVIEADEYDNMFLGLKPNIEVVCTLEHDHPDFFPTPASYNEAFIRFVQRLVPGGTLITCADDRGAGWLARNHWREDILTQTYGAHAKSDLRASGLAVNTLGGFSFTVTHHGEQLTRVKMQIPGVHNALNALAAIIVIHTLELSVTDAAAALAEFSGTGRRFEIVGEANGITVVDDYAHHPTEMRATLSAARARYPDRRIWAVWQPHTYSRTVALLDEFIDALKLADQVVITEVYAAREQFQGFSAATVADAMKRPTAFFAPTFAEATQYLLQELKPGDVLLVLSAGDADQISANVFSGLKNREANLG